MSVQMEQKVTSYEIAGIAKARLKASSHPALRDVLCMYDNGVLVLRGRLNSFFQTQLAHYKHQPDAAAKLLGVGEAPRPADLDAAELAAWTAVGNVLLNLDETISKG